MGQTLNYLIWPALFLLLAVAVVLGVLQKRRRLGEIKALAARRGLSFTRSNDHAFRAKFGQFQRFKQPEVWRATNTLRGTVTIAGRACRTQMGDYRSRDDRFDRNSTTHEFGYLLIQQPCGPTPDLRVREENPLDSLADALGFEDIDFESAEFSRRFHVSCADRSFAYALITPRMMEHFLAGAPASLESREQWWLCVEGEGLWNAARFERNLDWMLGFFERWPAYLLEDHSSQPADHRALCPDSS